MHLLIEVGKVKISKREHNIEHDDRKHDKFIKTGYKLHWEKFICLNIPLFSSILGFYTNLSLYMAQMMMMTFKLII